MTRRKRYSAEFKREALRRANEEGVTDVLVVEELGINARQFGRWRNAVERDSEERIVVLNEVAGAVVERQRQGRQIIR